MKNKYTLIIICVVALALLFGCAHTEETPTATTETVTSATVTEAVTEVAPSQAEATTKIAEASKSTTSASSSTSVTSTTAKQSTTAENKTSTTKKRTTKKSQSNLSLNLKSVFADLFSSISIGENSTDKTTTSNTIEKSTTAPKANTDYCTITIDCTAALKNRDKLKEGHEEYLPSSGYIIKDCSVKYEDGDTVFSLFQRACRENGISMRCRKTGFGMYISGINELDEKDCGGTSGWTYYVDGKFPNISTDNYKLSGGEKIEFKYVS